MTDKTPLHCRLILADLTTPEQSIDAWAELFGLPKPTLAHEDGALLLSDELFDWMNDAGASFDWIFCGDPRGMASAFRQDRTDAAA